MNNALRADRRKTSLWLTVGAATSAACFIVALLAEQAGVAEGSLAATDVLGVLGALPSFDPAAWATLGVYLVLVTPVVGIVVTALEYAAVEDRRTVTLAILVLASLAISVIAAVLR